MTEVDNQKQQKRDTIEERREQLRGELRFAENQSMDWAIREIKAELLELENIDD